MTIIIVSCPGPSRIMTDPGSGRPEFVQAYSWESEAAALARGPGFRVRLGRRALVICRPGPWLGSPQAASVAVCALPGRGTKPDSAWHWQAPALAFNPSSTWSCHGAGHGSTLSRHESPPILSPGLRSASGRHSRGEWCRSFLAANRTKANQVNTEKGCLNHCQ